MKFRLDRKTPLPRDAVFAWWTDFREDDHRHPGSPADSTRTILGRTGNEVWLRDRATRPMRVTIEERVFLNPPLGYAVDARYPAADVRYTYRFDAEGDEPGVLHPPVVPEEALLVPFRGDWGGGLEHRAAFPPQPLKHASDDVEVRPPPIRPSSHAVTSPRESDPSARAATSRARPRRPERARDGRLPAASMHGRSTRRSPRGRFPLPRRRIRGRGRRGGPRRGRW